jgi:hypothetical protein
VAEALGVVAVFVVAALGGLTMLAFRSVLSDAAIDAAELPADGVAPSGAVDPASSTPDSFAGSA